MQSEQDKQPGIRHRLHPSSLVFSFLGQAKQFFLPFVLLFFAAGDSWELWFALLIIPVLIYDTYRFITLRYQFANEELILTGGVFIRNERHVPFARIQNIDLRQGILQRLVGVAEARIETASGSEPEAILKVLSLDSVEKMRRAVFSGRTDRASKGESPDGQQPPLGEVDGSRPGDRHIVTRLKPKDLVLLGLNPGRGMGVVVVIWGLAWQMDLFEGVLNFDYLLEPLTGSPDASVWGYSALAVGIVFSLFILSIVWYFLRLFDFRLEREGDDFRSQGGLFTRHSTTIPRQRIQLISIIESPVHRLMGRVTIKVESAGGTGEPAENRHWFAPLVLKSDLDRILHEIDPQLEMDKVSRLPLAPRARFRMFKQATLMALGLSAICQLVFWPWGGLSVALFLPLCLGATHLESRYIAYARSPYGILYRNGALWRQMSLTLNEKVQVVSWNQSPFDRRYHMASLRVDTAGAGQAGHKIHVPYLPAEKALELQEDLVATAGRRDFSW